MSETKVTCRNNGPIRVEGAFTILDQEGNPFDLSGRATISLCRCGASQDKPFCDGSHRTAGFQSEIKARVLPPPAPKA
jgi:CDGSH-type Zn-finger protein